MAWFNPATGRVEEDFQPPQATPPQVQTTAVTPMQAPAPAPPPAPMSTIPMGGMGMMPFPATVPQSASTDAAIAQAREANQGKIAARGAAEAADRIAITKNPVIPNKVGTQEAEGGARTAVPFVDPQRFYRQSAYTPAHVSEQRTPFWTPGKDLDDTVARLKMAWNNAAMAAADTAEKEVQAANILAGTQDEERLKLQALNRQQDVQREAQKVQEADALDNLRGMVAQQSKLAAPDPAQYWRGLGFGGSVMMILADSLEKVGASMKREPPANLIEKAIDRSLQHQQAVIDKAKGDASMQSGLYAQLRQSGLDQGQALAAAKARRMEEAAQYIDTMKARTNVPVMQAKLNQIKAELVEKAAQNYLGLRENLQGGGKATMVAASGGGMTFDKEAYARTKDAVEGHLKNIKLGADIDAARAKGEGGEEAAKVAKEYSETVVTRLLAEEASKQEPPSMLYRGAKKILGHTGAQFMFPQDAYSEHMGEQLAGQQYKQEMGAAPRSVEVLEKAGEMAGLHGPPEVQKRLAQQTLARVYAKEALLGAQVQRQARRKMINRAADIRRDIGRESDVSKSAK